jgi:hypothetical protein
MTAVSDAWQRCLAQLAYVVMTLFEMRASHNFLLEIHGFDDKLARYETGDDKVFNECLDASSVKLKNSPLKLDDPFTVEYGYGDEWIVVLKLEKMLNDPDLTAKSLPRVLEGEGFGIMEDCGGVYALSDLVDALTQKRAMSIRNYPNGLE